MNQNLFEFLLANFKISFYFSTILLTGFATVPKSLKAFITII